MTFFAIGFSCIALGASGAALLAVAFTVRALATGEPMPGRRGKQQSRERS